MKKQKVALFQRVGTSTWTTVFGFRPDKTDAEADDTVPNGYVRISPWLEIDFPELDDGTIVAKQLEQLDKAEQAAREELQQRLNQINDARQQLLALTVKPAA